MASARQPPSIPVSNEEPGAGMRNSASSSAAPQAGPFTPDHYPQQRLGPFSLISRKGFHIYVTAPPPPPPSAQWLNGPVFSFTVARSRQGQTPTPDPYDRRSSSRGRITKNTGVKAEVSDLSEPDSYFTGTESYEGLPVCSALLTEHNFSVSLEFYIMIDTGLCGDTDHVHGGEVKLKRHSGENILDKVALIFIDGKTSSSKI